MAEVELRPLERRVEVWGVVGAAREEAVRTPVSGTVASVPAVGETVERSRPVCLVVTDTAAGAGVYVTAPFSGSVSACLAATGTRISTGAAVVVLEERDRLVVDFRIPRGCLERFEVGGRLLLHRPDAPPVQAEVRDVSDDVLRLEVRGSETKEGERLFRRFLVAKTEPSLVVPVSALVYEGGDVFVWLVVRERDGGRRVMRRYVDPGPEVGDMVVIKGGLSRGDEVVIEGHWMLRDGSRVEVVR